jgi:hypothetical protein
MLQNLIFGNFSDFFVGGAERRPLILRLAKQRFGFFVFAAFQNKLSPVQFIVSYLEKSAPVKIALEFRIGWHYTKNLIFKAKSCKL